MKQLRNVRLEYHSMVFYLWVLELSTNLSLLVISSPDTSEKSVATKPRTNRKNNSAAVIKALRIGNLVSSRSRSSGKPGCMYKLLLFLEFIWLESHLTKARSEDSCQFIFFPPKTTAGINKNEKKKKKSKWETSVLSSVYCWCGLGCAPNSGKVETREDNPSIHPHRPSLLCLARQLVGSRREDGSVVTSLPSPGAKHWPQLNQHAMVAVAQLTRLLNPVGREWMQSDCFHLRSNGSFSSHWMHFLKNAV